MLDEVDALAEPSLTKKPGKEVLELAVTDADKGTALRRLRSEIGAAAALYLGDDVTDEDGFRALEPDDVTVKVGEGDTAARFRVADVPGAVAVVRRLAELLDLTGVSRAAGRSTVPVSARLACPAEGQDVRRRRGSAPCDLPISTDSSQKAISSQALSRAAPIVDTWTPSIR